MLTEEQRNELGEIRKEFTEKSLIYAPNSIWHGTECYTSKHKKETVLKIEITRLTDFIEYLFEHSEHCDHISQTDAWNEFEEWEFEDCLKTQIADEGS